MRAKELFLLLELYGGSRLLASAAIKAGRSGIVIERDLACFRTLLKLLIVLY